MKEIDSKINTSISVSITPVKKGWVIDYEAAIISIWFSHVFIYNTLIVVLIRISHSIIIIIIISIVIASLVLYIEIISIIIFISF